MTWISRIRTAIATSCAILAGGSSVMAQEQSPLQESAGGLGVSVYGLGAALHTNKYISDSSARSVVGRGAGARISWDLPAGFTPFVGMDFADVSRSMGQYRFSNIDFGLRVKTPFLKRFMPAAIPYIEAAL